MRKRTISHKEVIEKITMQHQDKFYLGKGYTISDLVADLKQLEYQEGIILKAASLNLLSKNEKKLIDEIRYDCDGYKIK